MVYSVHSNLDPSYMNKILSPYSFRRGALAPLLFLGLLLAPLVTYGQEWSFTDTMSESRREHRATLLPTGKVLITGGTNFVSSSNTGEYLAGAELYDPTTGTWTQADPMSSRRVEHTATLLNNGHVLVTGGQNDSVYPPVAIPTATAELYDSVAGTWTTTDSMDVPRYHHSATLLNNGKVLVAGGIIAANAPVITSSAEIYDPATGLFSPVASMNTPHMAHIALLLQDGRVLVAGNTTAAEVYDPVANTWTTVGSMTTLRNQGYYSAVLLPNGKVLITGGSFSSPTSAEIFDPITNTFTATTPSNGPNLFPTTLLSDGTVLMTGGLFDGTSAAPAQIYDPNSATWTTGDTMNELRTHHTVTLLPTDDVLIAGGYIQTNATPGHTASAELLPGTVNQQPVLSTVGNKTVEEGELLQFTLSASDADGDNLTFVATNLPLGASFDPETATFSWTPAFDQAGNYTDVEFTVTDDGSPIELDVELITITVGDANRAPVVASVSPLEVIEGDNVTFTVTAADPDGDALTLSTLNLPSGAVFDTQTGIFSWTPTLAQAGVYAVTFQATDDGLPTQTGTTDVIITVGENLTPTEQTEVLVDTVTTTYELPANIENSYLANLKKVVKFIEDGKIQPAIGQLEAFVAKVEDDYAGGHITATERDTLIDLALALLSDLQ